MSRCPPITPVATFVVVTSTIGSFQLFELPYTLLQNSNAGYGPKNSGLTIVGYLYRFAFEQRRSRHRRGGRVAADVHHPGRQPDPDSPVRHGGERAMNGTATGRLLRRLAARVRRRCCRSRARLAMALRAARAARWSSARSCCMPFAWLVCAAFKDKSVLNEYTFLPPPAKISSRDRSTSTTSARCSTDKRDRAGAGQLLAVRRQLALPRVGGDVALAGLQLDGRLRAGEVPLPRARRDRSTFMLASLTIPGVVLLAPNFEVIWRLGWMDTLQGAARSPARVSVFGIFLFRQAMLGVPDDLIEAGRIDGCGEFRIYLTLVMPLVRPMTGAFCLISFLGAWNAFLAPNIFLQTQSKLHAAGRAQPVHRRLHASSTACSSPARCWRSSRRRSCSSRFSASSSAA